jgi:hypothetical protein
MGLGLRWEQPLFYYKKAIPTFNQKMSEVLDPPGLPIARRGRNRPSWAGLIRLGLVLWVDAFLLHCQQDVQFIEQSRKRAWVFLFSDAFTEEVHAFPFVGRHSRGPPRSRLDYTPRLIGGEGHNAERKASADDGLPPKDHPRSSGPLFKPDVERAEYGTERTVCRCSTTSFLKSIVDGYTNRCTLRKPSGINNLQAALHIHCTNTRHCSAFLAGCGVQSKALRGTTFRSHRQRYESLGLCMILVRGDGVG